MTPGDNGELAALLDFSARLGRQPLLVQASTGNTSVKIGHTLWIKASGKWLANAAKEEMFLPINCAETDRYLFSDALRPQAQGARAELKPSIETAMHLALPHRVVVHVHSISAIAWAVQCNGPSFLRERLEGIPWCWIPYTPSGAPLGRSIRASLHSSPDVFLLANHGLVIGGDNCKEAEARLKQVEERLAIDTRPAPDPDLPALEKLAASSDFRLPHTSVVHSLALDEWSTEVVSKGILYPCQAMFLGHRPCIVSSCRPISVLAKEYQDQNGFRPPALLIRSRGVLVAKDLTDAESEMLIGLSQVARRLPRGVNISYLSERRVKHVLNSGAYGDAQPIAKRASQAPYRVAGAGGSA